MHHVRSFFIENPLDEITLDLIKKQSESDRYLFVRACSMEEATAIGPAATANSASVPDGEETTPSESGPRMRLDWQEALMHGVSISRPQKLGSGRRRC
jgi:hypothetical protein